MVRRTLGVTHSGPALAPCHAALVLDREHGNGGAGKARQVALTELHEGLVGSPLQGVVEVIAGGRGELGRVSRDVHVDLVASTLELTVLATPVHRSPRVAETVEHVLERGRKGRMVQPVTTEPSVKNKEEMNHHFIH
jgi:hypothetical protein